MVPVAITVVIVPDDDYVPIPMFVAIADDCAIAVMPRADCYAGRSDANSKLFRTRRTAEQTPAIAAIIKA